VKFPPFPEKKKPQREGQGQEIEESYVNWVVSREVGPKGCGT